MNLPDFSVLEAIHHRYEEIQKLETTLLEVQSELLTISKNNQLQIVIDEKHIKKRLETKLKRKNIGDQIVTQRAQEGSVSKKISAVVKATIKQYNLDEARYKEKLERVLLQKIGKKLK